MPVQISRYSARELIFVHAKSTISNPRNGQVIIQLSHLDIQRLDVDYQSPKPAGIHVMGGEMNDSLTSVMRNATSSMKQR